MIHKAVAHGVNKAFQSQCQGTQVSHLQFADDSLFSPGHDISQVHTLHDILAAFELCSGLQVHSSKSVVFAVIEQAEVHVLDELLQCQTGMLQTAYLGLPLGSSSRNNNYGACYCQDSDQGE